MGILSDIRTDLEASVKELLDEYKDRLMAEALRICADEASAEDLVMRTFEVYFFKREKYDPQRGSLLTWLRAVMRNLQTDSLRRRKVDEVVMSPDEIERLIDAQLPADLHDDDERAAIEERVLSEAVNALSPKIREAVVLHYFESLPVAEVARQLRVSENSIKNRLFYARKVLTKRLKGKLGNKPLAVLAVLLFGITALFGAYQLGKVEKVEEVEEVEEEWRSGILSASVSARPQSPGNTSDGRFDLKQKTQTQETHEKQDEENAMNIGQKMVVGLSTALSVVLPLTTEATPCLKLPTTGLGAASVKGDGVSFSDRFDAVTSALTVSLWVKNPTARSQENNGTKTAYVIGNGCFSAKRGFGIVYQEKVEDGHEVKGFVLQVKDNTSGGVDAKTFLERRVITCNDVQDGNWHHIVVVYDATAKVLVGYYDGVAQDSSGVPAGWPVSANNASLINMLSIGRNAENRGSAFGGELAEVSLWNRALTAEEVAAVHRAPLIGPTRQAGLLGYWKFDEGEGTAVGDATGRGGEGVVKDGSDQLCSSYWGDDFDAYKAVAAQLTGFVGIEDGKGHACACTDIFPAGCTVKWAWNNDLENFTHDVPEEFANAGTYTNACRITKEGFIPFDDYAVVEILRNFYVGPKGDDSATGTKYDPFGTIQHAVDVLGEAGGRVSLLDGTYTNCVRQAFTASNGAELNHFMCVLVRKPIEIVGCSRNPRRVIIDAKDNGMGVFLDHDAALLHFVTIRNGNSSAGGASDTVGGNLRQVRGTTEDCIFTDGSAGGHGGNAFINGGHAVRCESVGGRGGVSGGACRGMFAIGADVIVENCLIRGVQGQAAAYAREGAKFVNCTIVDNDNNNGAARVHASDGSRFVNCAIFNNGGTAVKEWGNKYGSQFVSCACPVAIESGVNCRIVTLADAKFKNVEKNDYRLAAASSLIGAGNVQSYIEFAVSETDLARKERIRKNAICIGCYEFAQNGLMIMVR